MNYLSHFYYNHDVCGLPAEPYFVMGVALPDLWMRYSRKNRISWRAVRGARPQDPIDLQVRAGLLNHIAADRRFHVTPVFLRWQKRLKQDVGADGVHPVLFDFLAHAAIELALDHHLLRDDPGLVERFYDLAAKCDAAILAARTGVLGDVDTDGLGTIIAGFCDRRFMRRYQTRAGLCETVMLMLSLAAIPAPPPEVVQRLIHGAVEVSDPPAVWQELGSELPV